MGDESAEARTDDGGKAPNRAEQTEGRAAAFLWNAIGDRRGRDGKDAAGSGRLNGARDEEDREVRSRDREHAADAEHGDAQRVDRAPADDVGELGRDRNRHDVRKQVERERPRDVARCDGEALRDRGQRGRDDAEIERAREHAESERQEKRKIRTVERVARHRGGRRDMAGRRGRSHRDGVTGSRDRAPWRRTSRRDTTANI